jgi:chemotaxis-related protein WspD
MAEKIDCWKRIGVWGQEEPRCPKLEQVIHCRNCDVFSRAGRDLLERDLPQEYQDEWSQALIEKKEEDFGGSTRVIVFRVEKEWLALPAGLFAEIIDAGTVHTIPHRRNSVLQGVINVHGEIQLCVSLKELLGLESSVRPDDSARSSNRMMVVSKGGEQWVFPVDEVYGIHRLETHLLRNAPVTVTKSHSAFTEALFDWEDRSVAFLDHELLFYSLARSIQ